MKLSVVVPFYNELRTLPTVVDRLLKVDFGKLGLETELIFVDDGSTDAGRSVLDPLPRDDVRVIVHPRNQGKGAAIRTGVLASTGDPVLVSDTDLSTPLAEWEKLAERLPTHGGREQRQAADRLRRFGQRGDAHGDGRHVRLSDTGCAGRTTRR